MEFTQTERTAAACVIAICAGLVIPRASYIELERALYIWIMFSILCGVVVASGPKSRTITILKSSLLPSTLLPLACLTYMLIRWLADWIKDPDALVIPVMTMSAASVDPTTENFLIFASSISALLWVASIIVIALSAFGSRPIVYGVMSMSKAGPEAFDRYSKIVVSIAGLIAVLISFWSVFVSG